MRVDQPRDDLVRALKSAAGSAGIQVVVDYLWGAPAEAAIAAVTRKGLDHAAPPVRLVQVGSSSGATLTLPADVLRSSGLSIMGTGVGTASWAQIFAAVPQVLAKVAAGAVRVDVERVPLAEVESVWKRAGEGRRVVLVP